MALQQAQETRQKAVEQALMADNHAAVLITCAYFVTPVVYHEQASLALATMALLDALKSPPAYRSAVLTAIRLGLNPTQADMDQLIAACDPVGVPAGKMRANGLMNTVLDLGADPRSTANLLQRVIAPVEANVNLQCVTACKEGPPSGYTLKELAAVLIMSEYLVRRAENNHMVPFRSVLDTLDLIQVATPTKYLFRTAIALTINMALPGEAVRSRRDKMLEKFPPTIFKEAKSIACSFLRQALPFNAACATSLSEQIMLMPHASHS